MEVTSTPTQGLQLCSGGFASSAVCLNEQCRSLAFICGDICQTCKKNHAGCSLRSWVNIREKILTKYEEASLWAYLLSTIILWLSYALESLKKMRGKLKQYRRKYNLQRTNQVLFKHLKIKETQLTGQRIKKLLKSKHQNKRILSIIIAAFIFFVSIWYVFNLVPVPDVPVLNSENQQVTFNQTSIFIEQQEEFPIIQNPVLDSLIIQDTSYIRQLFFPLKIKQARLLYRASEQDFSIAKFHRLCDGHPNILLLLRNEFNRTLGAYSPVPFESGVGYEHTEDSSGMSFLFSTTFKEKFPIMIDHRKNTLYNDADWGPSYGQGCDLRIGDKSNSVRSSYSKFPTSFYNPNQRDADIARYRFVGSVFATYFLVQEWQIHELTFEEVTSDL